MNMNQKKQLYLLLNALREEVITDEQFSELEHLVFSDSEAAQEYVLYVSLWTDLQFFRTANAESTIGSKTDLELCTDNDFWQAMANYERRAPVIELPDEKPKRELIQKVVYPPREKRKISKFGIVTLMSVAAMLLLFLFLRIAPPKGGVEVATLADSIHAKWADAAGSMEKGTRLTTRSDELFLREGLAELVFDNNARVVIEGPAGFELLAEDQMDLHYGRIYATVPRQAIGFTVSTPTSRIIDLGTEFGVQINAFGDVQLHVIKGKTTLIAGGRSNRVNLEVTEGQAKKVSGTTQSVTDIPCETELFVRDISSDQKYVWKGQNQISLADMVGGGIGFGTGRIGTWLNLKTGEEGTDLIVDPKLKSQLSTEKLAGLERRFTDNRYKKVSCLPYVDGIFSPDGGAGDVQVSSRGDLWRDCPDTSGIYFEDIFNGSYIPTGCGHYLILNNQTYGTKEHPAIALHSNAGITFDLAAIRAALPGLEITQFRALCGISTDAEVSKQSGIVNNVTDFRVLVDGKKRFEALKMNVDSGYREITVPLSKEERFLTLVVTDGDLNPNDDWGFFAMPRLEIENAQ